MVKQLTVKLGSLALLAGVAACSCVDAPDLDIAPVAVESKYKATNYENAKVATAELEAKAAKNAAGAVMPLDRVFFGYDSAALSDAAQSTLKDVADYAKAKKISTLVVEGHADERGTREYNLALGDRRAVAVKRYLTSLGVDGTTITTVSYGKERPANQAHTEKAWAENRRGVVVFK